MKKNTVNPEIDPEKFEQLVQEQLAKDRAKLKKASGPEGFIQRRGIIVKAFYYLIVHPIVWPYHQIKESRGHVKSAASEFRDHLGGLQKNRDPWAKNAPDMSDFRQVLKHWEIEERDIERCISGMHRQMVLFTMFGLWGAYLLTGSLYSKLSGIPLINIGLIIVITRLWRVQVLQNRHFVYFKDWFLWGLFSWVGAETPIAREKRLNRESQYE